MRAGAGLALLILSAILLVGGFFVLGETFGPRESIQGIQWAIIAILGAAFISMQCAAVAVMLSLAERDVTNRPAPPSIKQGKDS